CFPYTTLFRSRSSPAATRPMDGRRAPTPGAAATAPMSSAPDWADAAAKPGLAPTTVSSARKASTAARSPSSPAASSPSRSRTWTVTSSMPWLGAAASFKRREGSNSCEVAEFAGCFIPEPEPDLDGYIQHALSLRGGYDFSDAWNLALHAMRSEGENEFDGGYSDYSETLQQVVGATLAWQAGERTRLALTAGRNVDASDQFKDGLATGWFSTHRDSATLQADLELATGQTLTLGADWLRDEVESDTAYERDRRSNRAAFAQYQGVFGAHSLQASVRHDDNDQFGEHGTGGI